jgi:hypothetical protein
MNRCEVCQIPGDDSKRGFFNIPNLFGDGLDWKGPCCVDCGLAFLYEGPDGLLRRFREHAQKRRELNESKNTHCNHDST